MKRDVFLSHATSDKSLLAEPLYRALLDAGVSVWYDKAEIKWGDSLLGKIEEGLRSSRYVLVLLYTQLSWSSQKLEGCRVGDGAFAANLIRSHTRTSSGASR